MTKEELRQIFHDATAQVYSPEARRKVADKLCSEQHYSNTEKDQVLLALNVELALNRRLLYEVLRRILCSEE